MPKATRWLAPAMALCSMAAWWGCGGGGGPRGGGETVETIVSGTGTPIADAVTARIGPAGGTLATADGALTLEVPAGAVAADTDFSIEAHTNPVAVSLGAGYQLEPHGVTFVHPVRLTYALPAGAASERAIAGLLAAYRTDDGTWRAHEDVTRDAAARTVTVATDHFSMQSLIKGAQLYPYNPHVKEGTRVDLKPVKCVRPSDDGVAPAPLIIHYECDNLLATSPLLGWFVDGIPDGNDEKGHAYTHEGDPRLGYYEAPARRPTPPDPLDVCVDTASSRYPVICGPVTVGDPLPLVGPFHVSVQGPSFRYWADGTVTLTPRRKAGGGIDEDDEGIWYDQSGTLTLREEGLQAAGVPCALKERPVARAIDTVGSSVRVRLQTEPLYLLWDGYSKGGEGWAVRCTIPNGPTFDAFIPDTFSTSCDGEIGAPVPDPTSPSGSIQLPSSCAMTGFNRQTMQWTLEQQQP
jgi:hypothetical protein